MSEKYDLTFLEDKLGKFSKEGKYPRTSLNEGKLFYVEKDSKKGLDNEIDLIESDSTYNPVYIWGFVKETSSVYVTRTFGENRIFIYNPKKMKKTDYIQGKLKVLKKLNRNNFEEIFDHKAVLDHFYKKLWDLRLDLGKKIGAKNGLSDKEALMEAQHIIDRIIFTYFICEKGLITSNGNYKLSGQELFSGVIAQMNDPWEYLKKLFFEQFARKHSKDLDCGGGAYIKVPYLNGGLFRPKILNKISETDLTIDYDWQNIFKILNSYTWIIGNEIQNYEEDLTPSEEEENLTLNKKEYKGNLTPEIIGHIYEKFVISIDLLNEIKFDELNLSSGELKRGNKKIGAYYTPEYITDHISKNTIKTYLFEKLGVPKKTDFKDFLSSSSPKTLEKAFEVLNRITICDPACGSGAFLLKAGEILLEYKNDISKILKKENDIYSLKKDIILNNLYGVDIQEGAVEICKLRLWLWLISSSKNGKEEPLPNIEYNFKVGNSLVGWLNEDIAQISLDNPLTDNLKGIFKGLIVFAEDKNERLLKRAEKLLKGFNLDEYIESYYIIYTLYRETHDKKAEKLKGILKEIKNSIYNSINPAFRDHINEKIKPKYHKDNPPITEEEFNDFNPFHWRVDFGHIIKKGGFDIIIGNPPYGNLLEKKEKKFVKNIYKSTKSEIAALFVERGIDLLKNEERELGYIITYAITFRKDFSKTRNIIKKAFQDCFISTFDRDKCRFFEGMSQSVSILLCYEKRSNKECNFFTSKMFRETPNLNDIDYGKSNGLLLGKTLKATFEEPHRLPKIGDKNTLEIIEKLVTLDKKVKDLLNNGSNNVWIRTSGNYWYNAWDKKPYESTEIKSINTNNVDLIICIMNSSLFYLWLRVYGDGRHMNKDIMNVFPLFKNFNEFDELIHLNTKRLMHYLFLNFDETKGRFSTSNVKPLIDISDVLLGKLYGLSNEQIDYILNFESVIRGGKQIPDIFYRLFDYSIFLNKIHHKHDVTSDITFINKIIDLLAKEVYYGKHDAFNCVQKCLKSISEENSDEKNLRIVQKFIKISKDIKY